MTASLKTCVLIMLLWLRFAVVMNISLVNDTLYKANGKRLEGNIKTAKKLYKMALESNSSSAMNALGEIYLRGEYNSEIDYRMAELYFVNASRLKNTKAMYNLALMDHYGLSSSKNGFNEMQELYLSAIHEDDHSRLSLGNKHRFGYGVPISCNTALNYYKAVVERNKNDLKNIFAMGLNNIRLSSFKGQIFNKEAVDYIKLNAENGKTSFQLQYGKILIRRNEFNPDVNLQTEAFKMIKLAAEKENGEAQKIIGAFYLYGTYVKKNYLMATQWLMRSIDNGNREANNLLGEIYSEGKGVIANLTRAKYYFEKTSSKSDPRGMFEMAKIIENEYGSKLNNSFSQKVDSLYRKSANLGYSQAINHLARKYSENNGLNSCSLSLTFYVLLAQRLKETQREFRIANERFDAKDFHHSLLLYMDLSFQGHYVANNNAAFILSRKFSKLRNFGKSRENFQNNSNQSTGYDSTSFIQTLTNELQTSNQSNTERSDKKIWGIKGGMDCSKLFQNPFLNSAYHFYSLAADRNDPEASRNLADYHYHMNLTQNNALLFSHQSFSLYKAFSAQKGRIKPHLALDSMEEERFQVVYQLYLGASRATDEQSTYNIGYMYQYGIGVPQDLSKAKEFYSQAVSQNKRSVFPVKVQLLVMYLQANFGFLFRWKVEILKAVETGVMAFCLLLVIWVFMRYFSVRRV